MDALTESLVQADVDAEMTALTSEDVAEKNLDASDEVEHLRNSLREVVHDDSVRPKMQCLMMDSTFSMVTMQGEDSGIAWETTPSRCTTPWASEAGTSAVDLSCPGSVPAGKIIFVMDEELISRRKKTKERTKQREILVQSSENISGRPELVGVSQPNVKPEEGDEEELSDPQVDKEQQLFSLVAEGSEILNIVVPPKLATVDEEESGEMVDNLSYLEDSVVPKTSKEAHDFEMVTVTTESVQVQVQHPGPSSVMDPPGAPVARPPGRGAAGNVDYFEPFTLIDAQAPGGPAVAAQGEVEQEVQVGTETEDPVKPAQTQVSGPPAAAAAVDESDTISLLEITSELLDEVFYGGTDDYSKSQNQAGGVTEDAPSKLPSKPSGSTLFGSQEEILTPIFLPEGPPKIIDPILLEEPKAMAFLYTDLYEEAVGSRKKEEDAESVTSEKSFHSRHSDREARGYLEKYALIDETPVVEVEPAENQDKEGPRMLSDDLYNFADFLSKPGKEETSNTEEEITDFFRSSANSSPCDIEPLSPSLEEEEQPQSAKKSKGTTNKNVSIKVEKVAENPVDSLSISSFEFPSEEPEWGTDEPPTAPDVKQNHTHQESTKKDLEMQKPVAPPRRKVVSPPKTRLDLTALTPVEVIIQEKEEAAGKEQREEEKETASPAETADEGDGDGEEPTQGSCNDALSEGLLAAVEPLKSENVEDNNTIRKTNPAVATEGKEEEINQTERATTQTEPEEAEGSSSPSTKTEVPPEKQGESSSSSAPEPAKSKAQCVIL